MWSKVTGWSIRSFPQFCLEFINKIQTAASPNRSRDIWYWSINLKDFHYERFCEPNIIRLTEMSRFHTFGIGRFKGKWSRSSNNQKFSISLLRSRQVRWGNNRNKSRFTSQISHMVRLAICSDPLGRFSNISNISLSGECQCLPGAYEFWFRSNNVELNRTDPSMRMCQRLDLHEIIVSLSRSR
jgi:hypothetical protein